jgi:hypothetical protein
MVKTTNGYARATSGTGNYLMNTVGAGTYTLTASAPGYALAKVPGVIVTDGNTTVQNLALMPVNILAPADAVITSESISNGVLDPGETVTVNLSLKNIGGRGASTANLVGTLRPTGGVVSPGGAQTYGAVASGRSGSMPFTFKVDPNQPCGNTLTATLALADGAIDYRTITYTFALGLHEVRFEGPPVRVPGFDNRGVNVPVKVSNFVGRVADLDFRIGGTKCTDYAWIPTVGINTRVTGAVTIKLKSPSGTVVTLIDKIGDYGRNFCKTYLDDDATNRPSIQNMKQGYAPFPGVFRPANPLSAFDGEDPNGTWVLSVVDLWYGGYVRDFALRISPGECAPPYRTYSISGQVKIGTTGPAFGDVLMRLDSPTPAGFAPRTTRTDSNGNYSFTDLPVGRNYTLKPAKVNYEFTPVVRRYTNLSANQANQNFAAKLKTYSIAGRVLLGNTSTGISDVGVTISSPTLAGFTPRKVKTNIYGIYIFDNLTAANDYRIEPTRIGYTFTPAMSILSNLSGDQIVTPGTIFRGLPTTALTNEWSMDSVIGEVEAEIRCDEASGSALILEQYEKLLQLLARR